MNSARPHAWLRPWFHFCPAAFPWLVLATAWLWSAGWSPSAHAQGNPAERPPVLSWSGQFIVTGSTRKSPLPNLPIGTANASLVRLEPALLSVSAERIKQTLYQLLGFPSTRSWQGEVHLVLHPALGADENVTIVSRPIDRTWSYLVELPDTLPPARFLRGMTGVLLLELADRQAADDGHSAEIPVWFIDGLSRQMQEDELSDVVLTAPDRPLDSPPPRRAAQEHNLDPLAQARQVLHNHPALTYDQLCWPTEAQLTGDDAGVYHASAQLLVAELLKLNDGPACFRQMLAQLPRYYNWQTAFQNAFHDHFPRPLDLEKWWALEVISFLSHAPGPAWTPAVSAGQLDELLAVPVEIRASSNAFPSHVEVTLQTVLHDFDPVRRMDIFETRLRDLRIAELRMAPQFLALTDEYCHVLASYLGERLEPAPRISAIRRPAPTPVRLPSATVIKRLNALDARRHALDASLQTRNLRTF